MVVCIKRPLMCVCGKEYVIRSNIYTYSINVRPNFDMNKNELFVHHTQPT